MTEFDLNDTSLKPDYVPGDVVVFWGWINNPSFLTGQVVKVVLQAKTEGVDFVYVIQAGDGKLFVRTSAEIIHKL